MKKNKKNIKPISNPDSSGGTPRTLREAEIVKLERQREILNSEVERYLTEYAKRSGDKSFRPKKRKAGSQPNDYSFKR